MMFPTIAGAPVSPTRSRTSGRVQYSVFECRLDERAQQTLRERLARLIDPEEDSLRIYRLCKECDRLLEVLGTAKRTDDPDIFVL